MSALKGSRQATLGTGSSKAGRCPRISKMKLRLYTLFLLPVLAVVLVPVALALMLDAWCGTFATDSQMPTFDEDYYP